MSGKQIARRLGISVRTVEDHFAAMRHSTRARSLSELIAYAVRAGLVDTGVPGAAGQPAVSTRPENQSRNSVRIGYARDSTRPEDLREQLAALAAAQCREIMIETAASGNARPQLHRALGMLGEGDTLVIRTPDQVARSIGELLVLLEEQLRAHGVNLHILAGTGAGLYYPNAAAIADRMLFTVASMAAEMERDLSRERAPDGPPTAKRRGHRADGRRTPGRPPAVSDGILAVVRARRDDGESVTAIARHLGIGRSTLYRALDLRHDR